MPRVSECPNGACIDAVKALSINDAKPVDEVITEAGRSLLEFLDSFPTPQDLDWHDFRSDVIGIEREARSETYSMHKSALQEVAQAYVPTRDAPLARQQLSVLRKLIVDFVKEPDPTAENLAESVVRQFGYWVDGDVGGYTTGGLSVLEEAFSILGWDDPHPAPEDRCDEPSCMQQASVGWPTRPGGTGLNSGYRKTCTEHWKKA